MYRMALRGFEKTLGPEHLWTVFAMSNMGAFYRARGSYMRARAMFQRALQGFEKAVGRESAYGPSCVRKFIWNFRHSGPAIREDLFQARRV
ncbi:hypothetical protein F4677DRAFT_414359 [Hypoxylon crocopeplum]|nr:hypothetical protein F4677DRAFT_414359 [Hypoxylon crocopeplum]